MEQKKTIVVVGATGAQGGGLVDAILNDPKQEFSVRAITRDIHSEKAKSLAKKGVELVAADVADKHSLVKAFKGAYGAYCVTFFWEHFSVEKEMEHAKNMAEAAVEAQLGHVIWSTLEDTRKWIPLNDDRMPTLQEKYKVPHFDGKGAANIYFENIGVPYTLLLTSFFWENFIYFGMGPQLSPDDALSITFPMGDKKLPGIAVRDIGKCALGIFKAGAEFQGKTVGIAGEHLTGKEMANTFTKIYDQPINYNSVPPMVYREFDFPGADDLGNMFQFKAEFESVFCNARPVALTKKLNPEVLTFEKWLLLHKNEIKMPEVH
ncbi:MAG: NmrA/HSCARG family protein [Pricia sp.]|nr:NmrA/HSCARG family protein [Pricia sp.]